MTQEEKLWKQLLTLIRAVRPLLLYLTMPAMLMMVGMLVWRHGWNSDEFVIRSGRFYYFAGLLITFLILKRHCKKRGESFADAASIYPDKIRWKKALVLWGMGFGISIATSAVLTTVPLPGWLAGNYSSVTARLYSGNNQFLAVISAVLLVPVVEEIIFRGYMINRLFQGFGERSAVWISSVIFALCHITPVWIIYALGMGYFLARTAVKEDNTAYSVFFHMGFNSSTIPLWLIGHNSRAAAFFYGSGLLMVLYGSIGAVGAGCLYTYYCREDTVW